MKSNILMSCLAALVIIVVPVLFILLVGNFGLSFTTLFLYLIPLLFCTAIVTSAFFYRQNLGRSKSGYVHKK